MLNSIKHSINGANIHDATLNFEGSKSSNLWFLRAEWGKVGEREREREKERESGSPNDPSSTPSYSDGKRYGAFARRIKSVAMDGTGKRRQKGEGERRGW